MLCVYPTRSPRFCRASISPLSAGCSQLIVAPSLENCLQLKEATSSGRLYHKPLTPWSGAADNTLILRHKRQPLLQAGTSSVVQFTSLGSPWTRWKLDVSGGHSLAASPELFLFPHSLSPKTSSSLYCVSRKPCLGLCFQETRSKALMLKKDPYTWLILQIF